MTAAAGGVMAPLAPEPGDFVAARIAHPWPLDIDPAAAKPILAPAPPQR